jgi:hypothetical protein
VGISTRWYKCTSWEITTEKYHTTCCMCCPEISIDAGYMGISCIKFAISYFRKECEKVDVVGSLSIYAEYTIISQISRMTHYKTICAIVRHALLIIRETTTSYWDSCISWWDCDIYNTKWSYQISRFIYDLSTSTEASQRKINRRIVSLKKEIEKSSKKKDESPEYSGSCTFFSEFIVVGKHSLIVLWWNNLITLEAIYLSCYYLRFIFCVVSKLSMRFPRNSRTWLSIAGIEKSVSVSIGTNTHCRMFHM